MRWLLLVVISLASCPLMAQEIEAKMLAQGSALLVIDGKQRMLRVGKTSPEGVKLISADGQQAVIEVGGRSQSLGLSRRIATSFARAKKAEVRLASSQGGHYRTPGLINGMPVNFLVDTGATYVSMNFHEAERLGIDFLAGFKSTSSTANGLADIYIVVLNNVSVGGVELHQVPAAVHDSDSPSEILLGNSFLSKVDIRIDQGVMVLRAKH